MKTISEAKIQPNIGGAKKRNKLVKVDWSANLVRVYKRHPLAVRSKVWPEIARMANGGDFEGALELAASTERGADTQFRAKLARRTRVERAVWFSRIAKADKELKQRMNLMADVMGTFIGRQPSAVNRLPRINDRVHDESIEFRKWLRKWLNSVIRDTTKISLRAKGDALRPIFKASKEGFDDLSVDQLIMEVTHPKKINAFVTGALAGGEPGVKLNTAKWRKTASRVIKKISKGTFLANVKLSERIWEQTTVMEQQMKRIVTSGIGSGAKSFDVAKKVKQYLKPIKGVPGEVVSPGAGIYKNPFANIRRVMVTEANRAYAKASAEFAKSKPWIVGKQFNVSGFAGRKSDICDTWNGVVVSVEQFDSMVDNGQFPFHPHCRCYDTDVINEDFVDFADAA